MAQREDYPDDALQWYMLLFDKCKKCGLRGAGQINGQAGDWIEAEYVPHSLTFLALSDKVMMTMMTMVVASMVVVVVVMYWWWW